MSIDPKNRTPLIAALDEFRHKNPLRLHVPGHGGKLPGLKPVPEILSAWDVTELEGLDDLHNPRGVIAAAQEKAALLYGARHTFFLVNGTTAGIQALIAATCDEERPLVLPRNAHRSVLGGLILSGARPVFLEPEVVPEFGFAAGFRPEKLEDKLQEIPVAGAVLSVHPNYYGVVGDLAAVADICRRYNVPLLVDEAHGTHLRFHPALPGDALSMGASAVVQSVHKTGGALTQASWLHLGSAGVDREKVAGALRLLQTSSPSYILMASLDAARDFWERCGGDALGRLLRVALETAEEIGSLPGMEVLGQRHMGIPGAMAHDPTRLVVSVRRLGITGYDVAGMLAEKYGIYVEMADANNIVAVLPLGISKSETGQLVRSLAGISRRASGITGKKGPLAPLPAAPRTPPQVLTPRRAWLASRRTVPLSEAAGLISAEWVAVCPPGIAVIYPGEEITPEVVEYLLQARASGIHCQGAADPGLNTICVVDNA